MDTSGRLALHHAVRRGHIDVVALLTGRREVHVNAADSRGMMAIHHAARGTPEDFLRAW